MRLQLILHIILSIFVYINIAENTQLNANSDGEIRVLLQNKEFNLESSETKVLNPVASLLENHVLRNRFASTEAVQERNAIEDAIKIFLESFRDIVIHGNEIIPPLDPLVIDSLGPFTYQNIGVRASIGFLNLNLADLRWYVVDSVTVNPLRLTFGLHLTIPRLTFTGSYDAQARVLLLTHKAGGNFRIFCHRMEFGVNARLGTNIIGGGHLFLREFNIKIFIADVNIQIEGMVGSSVINNFINNLIQSLTQDVVHNELENISALISQELFDTINDILKQFTLDDLFP